MTPEPFDTIEELDAPAATSTSDHRWIRSTRPDGHRSLWCHVGRWAMIEVASNEPPRLWIGIVGEHQRTYTAAEYLDAPCRMYACPTPTPEDLAWLRGAK